MLESTRHVFALRDTQHLRQGVPGVVLLPLPSTGSQFRAAGRAARCFTTRLAGSSELGDA
jgi:hypothetical protein